MGDGCLLRMRDAGRVTPEIIDTLVEHPWSHPCLEEQARVHDHVLLTVNLAREVEHVISEQFSLVELGPGRRRQFPIEESPPTGLQVSILRQPLVGQDREARDYLCPPPLTHTSFRARRVPSCRHRRRRLPILPSPHAHRGDAWH